MPQLDSENHRESSISEAHCCFNEEFIKSLPEPVCLLDFDCRILMVNESAMNLFGSKPEQYFIGKSVLDFIIPEDHPKVLQSIEQCINSQLASESEYSIRGDDGTIIPIRTTSFSLSDGSKIPIALCSLVKDKTQIDDLPRGSTDYTQKARLYLDLLSHDISNNLQVILSSAELLRASTIDSQEERLIKNIVDSVLSCRRLIRGSEILEHYRRSPMEVQNLELVVENELYELIKSTHDVEVHANFQICDAKILADEFVSYLISNILENAWLHNTSNEKHVWIKLYEDEEGYKLSISDNGPGLLENNSVTGNRLGDRQAGIGLYICNALIDKYQGRIEITSRIPNQPNLGTEVVILFPRYSGLLSSN
jgi:PAS domain S-box-containing protein